MKMTKSQTLLELNPYPEEIFPNPKKEDLYKAIRVLKENNISVDNMFGSFGREVWIRSCEKLEEIELDIKLKEQLR